MKQAKPTPPEYKRAYFVQSWGDKIIKGYAFTLKYVDFYEKTKAFFMQDGKDVPTEVDSKQVVYSEAESHLLLKREINARKEYYQKELKEATEKISSIDKLLNTL
jgi:hypothetical protein